MVNNFPNLRTLLTPKGMKHHPAVAFIYFCGVAGCTFCAWYTLRLGSKSTDVSWRNGQVQNPNERYKQTDQYKFYSPIRDYKKNNDVPKVA